MEQPKIVTELTNELADKICKQIKRKQYDDKVSKETVLHHLKQCKAEMGKLKKQFEREQLPIAGINRCMDIITNKIAKINN